MPSPVAAPEPGPAGSEEHASRPVGPYSPVVEAGQWLVVSGQLGLKQGKLVDGGAREQLHQAVANLESLLAERGADLRDVVKTTVFMTDIADFSAVNEAYVQAFRGHRPARSAVAVAGLPLGASVEIEAWAFRQRTVLV